MRDPARDQVNGGEEGGEGYGVPGRHGRAGGGLAAVTHRAYPPARRIAAVFGFFEEPRDESHLSAILPAAVVEQQDPDRADGVLVHHLPDRDILFGDSDPVAEDVLMIGGGGGGGGGETVVTGDEVWISVTGENYISHIGPGPEAYTTICELAGEPCCLYAVSVGIAWDADGHVIKGGYANASGLPDVTWVETGT